MAAALEETPVTYEELADLEKDFDDAETEIIRQQIALTAPLYERRTKTVSLIPNFWPLVLEQAPPDIDQYIQPSDSSLLLSSLLSLSVSNFEINLPNGDPRSMSIKFEFSENEYFEDKVLEKKFWHRRAKDGWTGFVSEPVGISWRKERDLTSGLLDLVVKAWEKEKTSGDSTKSATEELSPEHRALKKKIDNTGMGGLSFFAWFGFIGRKISAEESAEATAVEIEKRRTRKAGIKAASEPTEEMDDDEVNDMVDMSLEIFPDGDELAIALTEDLWPGAIKYFTQAQEQDALSDADFESDDEELDAPEYSAGEDNEEPPAKKQRSR